MSALQRIAPNGVDQGNLVRLLTLLAAAVNELQTNLAGVNAKLDADVGINDTNYAALWDPAATAPASATDTVKNTVTVTA